MNKIVVAFQMSSFKMLSCGIRNIQMKENNYDTPRYLDDNIPRWRITTEVTAHRKLSRVLVIGERSGYRYDKKVYFKKSNEK